MTRKLFGLAVGLLVASAAPALAQRDPGAPGSGNKGTTDDIRKLQIEIEKLQAEIQATEAQIRNTLNRKVDPRPKEPMSGSGANRPSGKDPEPKRNNPPFGGFGQSGFGPPGGGSGFGPGGNFGPGPGGMMGGIGGFGSRGTDVKSLQAELDRLHQTSKMIAERTKDVEVQLKKAIQQEEEAKAKDRAKASVGKSDGTGTRDTKVSSDVEKRLDRIEQALDEIRQELRRRK